MSIRWKLFLSLVTLTVGSSVLALWLAEQEFRESIRDQVRERFEAQIEGLLAARRERLDKVRELCTELAGHESMRRRFEDPGGPTEAREILKRFEELRGMGAIDGPRNGRQDRPGWNSNPARDLPLMGVVHLDGEVSTLGACPARAHTATPATA